MPQKILLELGLTNGGIFSIFTYGGSCTVNVSRPAINEGLLEVSWLPATLYETLVSVSLKCFTDSTLSYHFAQFATENIPK